MPETAVQLERLHFYFGVPSPKPDEEMRKTFAGSDLGDLELYAIPQTDHYIHRPTDKALAE